GDSFECFYTNSFTDRELNVVSAKGLQGPGGHHINIYYTDITKPAQHHPCSDEEMLTWHQIVGASAQGEPVMELPEGLAIKVPAGKQLVMQAHYINTTGATEKTKDSITVNLIDPASIKSYVNMWAYQDGSFDIPPHALGESVSTCTLAKDLQFVILIGHL